jgi:type 1 glutamine amidotransferase
MPVSRFVLVLLLSGICVFRPAAGAARAADIYVNHETGDDRNPGSAERPLATARRAVQRAGAGDTIHLLPEGAIYREMLVLADISGITIEGNGCTLSGADPLPDDPDRWERVGQDLHRMRITRNGGDRYLLVKDGKAERMGRNAYTRGPLATQFPSLGELQPGEFRVEPIDEGREAWLYVKGSLAGLEWAVRTEGLSTSLGRRVRDVTIRNLDARHVLNDGFNFHGDAQNVRLIHVNGYENYDNGISPHGGCSITVENGKFWDNGSPAWAQGDATETVYRRCEARGSGHQWEVVFAGGVHLIEDSTIRLSGNEFWLVHWPPREGARKQIAFAGKDPDAKPQYTLRRTQILGDPEKKGTVKIGAGVTLVLDDCTFTNVTLDVDPAAVVRVAGGTLNGRPLEAAFAGVGGAREGDAVERPRQQAPARRERPGVTPDWWPGPTPPEVRDARMNNPWPNEQQLKRIEELTPDEPVVAPAKPRKVLVWGRLWTHWGNAFCQESLKIIGRKTGAFEVVASDDPRLLLPESLKDFDAVFWNSLHDQQPFLPPNWKELPPDELAEARKLDAAVKQSILRFVTEEGKGIAGVVGSIAALRDWPEYGEMMGAFYGGHYTVDMVIRVEDPDHPLVACFGGEPFEIKTLGYIPAAPFSRERVRVLLSLDMTRTTNPAELKGQEWLKPAVEQRKGDFPISWVREHGKGRVFYVALGYRPEDYYSPVFLRYLLAGAQFVTGDLPADTTPSDRDTAPREN